jgi:DNA-binding CsgD family transcriptional regulator
MGAMTWARRAKTEFLATGAQAPPRQAQREADLTPQERRVAGLAAIDFRDAEIASQMLISLAPVDYHLRKVFRKLGVTSRVRLAHILGELDETQSTGNGMNINVLCGRAAMDAIGGMATHLCRGADGRQMGRAARCQSASGDRQINIAVQRVLGVEKVLVLNSSSGNSKSKRFSRSVIRPIVASESMPAAKRSRSGSISPAGGGSGRCDRTTVSNSAGKPRCSML